MTGIEPMLVAGGVWLWQTYSKDAFGWLVKRLGLRAEELKEAGWEKVNWQLASRKYRQKLIETYGDMQIFGMNRPVPLGDIFTDVYVLDTPTAWRRHAVEEMNSRSYIELTQELEQTRISGIELVREAKNLFILGQPGAGKTTFLKYLVMQAVEDRLPAIPIFISLKDWSDANIELMPFIVRQFIVCNFPNAQPFIEKILEEGKAIVLFDGLDEVNLEGGKRQRIINAVRDFARQYNQSQVVITCRTAATDYMFEQFHCCELANFTQKQIATFVARWFRGKEIKRDAFLKALLQRDNEGLRELATRPLLLTMLCLTFDETMAFPRRRAELYEEAINALLNRWDSSRSIQRDVIYHKLSLGYKRQLLMEIAAETFEKGELLFYKNDLVRRIETFVSRLPATENKELVDGEVILRSIEAQHGIIVERARDIYSFSHLTFHEYFTARYIAEHPSKNVLESAISHAADPQWREVLLLMSSLLDHVNASTLFEVWTDRLRSQVKSDIMIQDLINWSSIQGYLADNGNENILIRIYSTMLILMSGGEALSCFLAISETINYIKQEIQSQQSSSKENFLDIAKGSIRDYRDIISIMMMVQSYINTFLEEENSLGYLVSVKSMVMDLAQNIFSSNNKIESQIKPLYKALSCAVNLNNNVQLSILLMRMHASVARINRSYDIGINVGQSFLNLNAPYSIIAGMQYLAANNQRGKNEELVYSRVLKQLEKFNYGTGAKLYNHVVKIIGSFENTTTTDWLYALKLVQDFLYRNKYIYPASNNYSSRQKNILKEYLVSNLRLLECLELTVTNEHGKILSQVLTTTKPKAKSI